MKMRASLRCLLFVVATMIAATPAVAQRAAEGKASGSKSAAAKGNAANAKQAPLKMNVDRKPINREAADRVSYAPIVKRTSPSVVYVYSSQKVASPAELLQNDPTLRRFFDLPEGGSKSKGRTPPRTRQGLGSGVVMTADGYILTNHHVVADADEVRVSIGDSNKRYEAEVVGRDPQTDIAVLKIEAAGLVPAVFGDSEQVQVGDVVLAIGNPFGIGQSVSRGVVSALGRAGLDLEIEDFIQTDAAINMGNSGGALLDTEGRVIGINTAILSGSGGFNGVGFAIPINLVRFVSEQIVNKGRVERGMLGVRIQDLTEDLSAEFGTEKGALVAELTPDSPAEKAGLKAGDVITQVNGREIRDGRHLTVTVSQNAPESEVTVEYLRDGRPTTTKVILGLRPNTLVADSGPAAGRKEEGVLNGVHIGEITSELRTQLQLPSRIRGVIITEIEPDSPSAAQGLRKGDIILELDRRPISDADQAVQLSEEIKGPKVLVLIWREGRTRYLVVDESKE